MKVKNLGLCGLLIGMVSSIPTIAVSNNTAIQFRPLDPPVTNQTTLRFGARLDSQLGLSCHGFKPKFAIKNTLNEASHTLELLSTHALDAGKGMILATPLLMIKKLNPSLYDLIQHLIVRAEYAIDLNFRTCEDILKGIDEGRSPYQDWMKIGKHHAWMKAATHPDNRDIHATAKQIAAHPLHDGIPWIHGKQYAGGKDQLPIWIVRDTVIAGYNMLVDSHRALDDSTPAPKGSPLAMLWPTPDAAGQWAQRVLGDLRISAGFAGGTTQAGLGLTSLTSTCHDPHVCVKTLVEQFQALLHQPATPHALAAVSTPAMPMTTTRLVHLRILSSAQQILLVKQLAQEIALQRLVKQAEVMRRLLLTGQSNPVILRNPPAVTWIHQALAQLDDELRPINALLAQSTVLKQLEEATRDRLNQLPNSEPLQ